MDGKVAPPDALIAKLAERQQVTSLEVV